MAGRQDSLHPTSAEPTFNHTRLGESSLRLVQQVSHGTGSPWSQVISYDLWLERARLTSSTPPGAGPGGAGLAIESPRQEPCVRRIFHTGRKLPAGYWKNGMSHNVEPWIARRSISWQCNVLDVQKPRNEAPAL